MKREVLDQLLRDREAKRPVVLVTDLESGDQQLIYPGGDSESELQELASLAQHADRSSAGQVGGRDYFLNVFNPPLRMLIVGAVHIAQPLSEMAAIAGFEVCVIDPRSAFSSPERFPGSEVVRDWPDDALRSLAPDTRTAIVTLTHDPKLDDPALQVALRSTAFFVGSLGSKRTHAARLKRLHDAGFSDEECAKIHGPVGLDIGAKSPAEIAASILAQVVQALRLG